MTGAVCRQRPDIRHYRAVIDRADNVTTWGAGRTAVQHRSCLSVAADGRSLFCDGDPQGQYNCLPSTDLLSASITPSLTCPKLWNKVVAIGRLGHSIALCSVCLQDKLAAVHSGFSHLSALWTRLPTEAALSHPQR